MSMPAPDWDIAQWFNTPKPIALTDLRGKVVVALGFQMLCPGCVSRAIPQMSEVEQLFSRQDVAVIGLHTVFEHHAGMAAPSLAAFLYEYRVTFPVGIDRPDPDGGTMPVTMARYTMRGTPTILVIDRKGLLVHQQFGHISDMQLGARIAALVNTPTSFLHAAVPIDSGCRSPA